MKKCHRCGVEKSLDNYRADERYTGGYMHICRQCENRASSEWGKKNKDKNRAKSNAFYARNREKESRQAKEYRDKNPEKMREVYRRYRKNHPESMARWNRIRRAYENGQTEHFTNAEWDTLKCLYGNVCVKCGSDAKLEPDHIVPISRNGRDTIENIQPLCHPCNASKNATTVDYRWNIMHGD